MSPALTGGPLGVGRLVFGADAAAPGGVSGWLLHFHGPTAYVLVGALAFAEAALMVGFFIPGETAVVIGGALASLHRVNLTTMIVVVVVCAIVGDSVGFELGKLYGPWLLDRRPLKGNAAVARTRGLLERYGGPAVFLGRFVAYARAIVPGLAGMSGLRYRVFLPYNVAGGVIWGVGYTLLGYAVGVSFQRVLTEVGLWSLAVVAGLIAVFFGARWVVKRRRRRLGGDRPDQPAGPAADVPDPSGPRAAAVDGPAANDT
jgi:membrane protein DedA with SNARE-associated domain